MLSIPIELFKVFLLKCINFYNLVINLHFQNIIYFRCYHFEMAHH